MEKYFLFYHPHPGHRAVITSPNIQTEDGELMPMAGGDFWHRATVQGLEFGTVNCQEQFAFLQIEMIFNISESVSKFKPRTGISCP